MDLVPHLAFGVFISSASMETSSGCNPIIRVVRSLPSCRIFGASYISLGFIGEMEPTLMLNSIKRGVLLGALRSAPFHSETARIAHLASLDPKISPKAKRGTLFEASLRADSNQVLPLITEPKRFHLTMPDEVYEALLARLEDDRQQCHSHSTPKFLHRKSTCEPFERLLDPLWGPETQFTMNGFSHALRTTTECNSFVRFRLRGDSLTGQIHHIFIHKRVTDELGESTLERFIAVRQYRPLTELEGHDSVYGDFPDLEANLHHREFLPGIIILRPQDIECQLTTHEYDDHLFGPVLASFAACKRRLHFCVSRH